ncbi:MAG: hypothetical protein ACOC49_02830 [Candidatus Bipolaricaulota bacterium]
MKVLQTPLDPEEVNRLRVNDPFKKRVKYLPLATRPTRSSLT